MSLWMAVTADKFELPIFIEDTAKELAFKLGIPVNTIRSAVNKKYKASRNKMKFVKVEVDDND